MATDGGDPQPGQDSIREPASPQALYARQVADLRAAFARTGDGFAACQARSAAVDDLIRALWAAGAPDPDAAITLAALGGYGRGQLFPFSDIDLLLSAPRAAALDRSREAIRRLTQALWDCGLKVSLVTRATGELDRFKSSDPESALAQLDLRFLGGSRDTFDLLQTRLLERRSARESRAIAAAAAELTRQRHARFGRTLFHLEPNVKDAPGGLRDANLCGWLPLLRGAPAEPTPAFRDALRFLTATRVFLHLRHGRDDNTLDWHAQDEAAAQAIGLTPPPATPLAQEPAWRAANWMRAYFRHARAIERELARELDRSELQPRSSKAVLRAKAPPRSGFVLKEGVVDLKLPAPGFDPAGDSDIVLGAFSLMAQTGVTLAPSSEERLTDALPLLSANLEDGPHLWARLRSILIGPFAGHALRAMHAIGVLELILPEFHGIDALVIRDAYHRYTVDEHTFVLIDVLHALAHTPAADAPEWRLRFRSTLEELPHPELLFLAALLHDTGKGRATGEHAALSARLAQSVCERLELGTYETGVVVRLIDAHLEMSAALRRDIFDTESVRVFADKVQTHDLLRMLTLFTYADISAVHPDALTPWKAENLWRLSMAAANQLDRTVDGERVHTGQHEPSRMADTLLRALGRTAWPGAKPSPSSLHSAQPTPDRTALERFLEGFPERYLRTRNAETIAAHLRITEGLAASPVLLEMHSTVGEITVVARDRPHLFADLAAVLAGWGMDVLTAEAFSNAAAWVVDTFRFADSYRTLELNPEERARFVADLQAAAQGQLPPSLADGRRRSARPAPRRLVETRIDFDNTASAHSTLMQIMAQNLPGLLRATTLALSNFGCSVEVALIDTEGDMAIDVFYLTRAGRQLQPDESASLRTLLENAIRGNAK